MRRVPVAATVVASAQQCSARDRNNDGVSSPTTLLFAGSTTALGRAALDEELTIQGSRRATWLCH